MLGLHDWREDLGVKMRLKTLFTFNISKFAVGGNSCQRY